MQRLTIRATVRRKRDTDSVVQYLAAMVEEAGATVTTAYGVPSNRGGSLQVLADAADAVAVLRDVRAKLDAETNGYAADGLNEMAMAAFRSRAGGILCFANESYAAWRETA